MGDEALRSQVRGRREAAQLTQQALADRIGLSRQGLSAIEAGRSVPSTSVALRLAQALGCPVEALFQLDHELVPATLAAPAPGQRVALGRVDGRWIAHPQPSADRGAAAVVQRVEGGVAWVRPLADVEALASQALVAGCAPLLGLLADHVGRRGRGPRATWLAADSGRALQMLAEGLVHVAGLHLVGSDVPGGHRDVVKAHLPASNRWEVLHLTRWQQGLVVAPGNPLGLRGVGDLARAGLRVVGRAEGSGAQRLLQRLLAPAPVPTPVAIAGGHDEVARMVRWGVADVGVAIEAAALAHGLHFLALAEERFDLVVRRDQLGRAAVEELLATLGHASFRAEARHLPGYDLREAGHATTVHT